MSTIFFLLAEQFIGFIMIVKTIRTVGIFYVWWLFFSCKETCDSMWVFAKFLKNSSFIWTLWNISNRRAISFLRELFIVIFKIRSDFPSQHRFYVCFAVSSWEENTVSLSSLSNVSKRFSLMIISLFMFRIGFCFWFHCRRAWMMRIRLIPWH